MVLSKESSLVSMAGYREFFPKTLSPRSLRLFDPDQTTKLGDSMPGTTFRIPVPVVGSFISIKEPNMQWTHVTVLPNSIAMQSGGGIKG